MPVMKVGGDERDTLISIRDTVVSQAVSTGRSFVNVTDAAGNGTVTSYAFNAKALLDSIAAQTAGVAGTARTITRNANGTLTIA